MKKRSFFGAAGTLSGQLVRRVVLLSLIAFLALAAVTAVGLGASLQGAQRQLSEAGVVAVRAFDEFLGNIQGDLLAAHVACGVGEIRHGTMVALGSRIVAGRVAPASA